MLEVKTIDYKVITCPKCNKKHFKKIQQPTWTFSDMFVLESELIYKDGILQNPPKPTPIKELFKCLECNCNFRVEYFDINNFKVVDVDLEIEKTKEEIQKRFKQNIKNTKVATASMAADDVSKIAVSASNDTQLTLSDEIIERDEFECKFTDLEKQIYEIKKQINQLKTDILFK